MKKGIVGLIMLLTIFSSDFLHAEDFLGKSDLQWDIFASAGGSGQIHHSPDGVVIEKNNESGTVVLFNKKNIPLQPHRYYLVKITTASAPSSTARLMLQFPGNEQRKPKELFAGFKGNVAEIGLVTQENDIALRVHLISQEKEPIIIKTIDLSLPESSPFAVDKKTGLLADAKLEWSLHGGDGKITFQSEGCTIINRTDSKTLTFFNRHSYSLTPGKRYSIIMHVNQVLKTTDLKLMLGFPANKNRQPSFLFAPLKNGTAQVNFTAQPGDLDVRIHLLISGAGEVTVDRIMVTESNGESESRCYESKNFPPEELAEISKTLPGQVSMLEDQLQKIEQNWKFHQYTNLELRKKIDLRLELAHGVIDFIKTEIKKNTDDSLLFARRGQNDLIKLVEYFQAEWQYKEQELAAPAGKIISVTDFGAVGDGISDDAPAFHRALNALKGCSGKKQLLIPAGKYLLASPEIVKRGTTIPDITKKSEATISYWNEENLYLGIVGFSDLTVKGEPGAELIFKNFLQSGVGIIGGRNVTIEGLSLYYIKDPFIQGTIAEVVDDRSILWKPDPISSLPEDHDFDGKLTGVLACGQSHNSDGAIVRAASGKFPEKYEKLKDGSYRIFIERAFSVPVTAGMRPGQKFIVPRRDHRVRMLFIHNSSFCTIRNVTLNNSPASGFSAGRSNAINFINCRIIPRPGRFMSTNADGIHVWNNTGIGPFVSNCYFRNMGDDAFNTYYRGQYLYAAQGNELIAKVGLVPNQRFIIVSPDTGVIKTEASVIAAQTITKQNEEVSKMILNHSVPPNIITYDSLGILPYSNKHIGEKNTGKRDLGEEPDVYFSLGENGLGTVISNNDFSSNRNNALVIQGTSVVVADNRIDNVSIAIRAGAFLTWKEGPPPYNVIVRNNTIKNCTLGIQTGYQLKSRNNAPMLPLRHFSFLDNRIDNCLGVFDLNNIDGLAFVGNRWTDGTCRVGLLKNVDAKQNYAGSRLYTLPESNN